MRRTEPPAPIHHRLPLAGPGRGRVWGAEAQPAGHSLTRGAPAQLGPLEGQACLPRAGSVNMSGLWGSAHSAWRGQGQGSWGAA